MRGRRPWLSLWPVWAIPGVVLLVNVVWVAGVRGTLLSQGPALAGRVARLSDDCNRLDDQIKTLAATRASLESLQAEMGSFRGSRLGGMRERLVPFITEVVKLAQDAGLRPERVSYGVQKDEKSGLTYFSAAYSVEGSYDAIRKLVFLFERSEKLILLEGLRLQGDDTAASTNIKFGLTVGTFFADTDKALMKQLGVQEVSGEAPDEAPKPAETPAPVRGGLDGE
jgi:hypothetical protein